MKEIILKKLTLKNFQGTRSKIINCGSTITNIFGYHETGKTTMNNAFRWLLFGKDSKGNTEFEIKPIDRETGEAIHGLDTSVEGIFEINGERLTFKKVLSEDWTKKRGNADRVLTGNTTKYYVDDVPKKKNEYENERDELINEEVFKMITDPHYFAEKIHWKVRRGILFEMIGEKPVEEIEKTDKTLKGIAELLNGKDIEDVQNRIAAEKKALNKEVKAYTIRIDEAANGLVRLDFETLRKELTKKNKQLENIENEIESINQVDHALQKQIEQIEKINKELATIEAQLENKKIKDLSEIRNSITNAKKRRNEIEDKIEDAELDLERKQKRLQNTDDDIKNLEKTLDIESKKIFELDETELKNKKEELNRIKAEKEKINNELILLREKFKNEQAKFFAVDEDEFVCPTCKRKFDDADIQVKTAELKKNFEEQKEKQLEEINKEGVRKKSLLAGFVDRENEFEGILDNYETKKREEFNLEKAKKLAEINNELMAKTKIKSVLQKEIIIISKQIEEMGKEIKEPEKIINGLQIQVDNYEKVYPAEYNLLIKQIEEIANKANEPEDKTEKVEKLKEEKQNIIAEIKQIEKELTQEENNKKIKARIEELKNEEREIAQKIADLENDEFLCERFIKAKARLLEPEVEKLFKIARFKFFKEQINGGIRETCDVVYKGVSKNINGAGRVNVGLDIINTLTEHFQVRAPIFLDEREGILDNYMIETKSQIINLFVSEKDKKLRIEIPKTKKVA